MPKKNYNYFRMTCLFFMPGMCILQNCASRKPQPEVIVSQYSFHFEKNAYRIRSISSDKPGESRNELIGNNFMAADFDQDQIIDQVVLGEVNRSLVQKVYTYGLNMLAGEDKLQQRFPAVNRYVHESRNLREEIRSFIPANANPFNEFLIIDKRPSNHRSIVIIDQNADGTLDEVLNGSAAVSKFQSRYSELIETGLKKGALIKVGQAILVNVEETSQNEERVRN